MSGLIWIQTVDTLMLLLQEFFKKVLQILKPEKLPSRQRVNKLNYRTVFILISAIKGGGGGGGGGGGSSKF